MKRANKEETERIQMPRWTVTIPGWKELGIERFHIAPTYIGVLEGTTEGINRVTIEKLPELAGAVFCAQRKAGVIAVHFAKPSAAQMRRPFPDFLCMAEATAEPVPNDTMTDDTLCSRVVCCWFTSDLNRSIEVLMIEGIQPFKWDDYAENCEL